MSQDLVVGGKVFGDYSGKKLSIVNPKIGEIREALDLQTEGRTDHRRKRNGSVTVHNMSAKKASGALDWKPTGSTNGHRGWRGILDQPL